MFANVKRFVWGPALLALLAAGCGAGAPDEPAAEAPAESEAALVERARGIHDRVIALDTHDDINPSNFTAEVNYTQRLDTQVNLPKMVEGGLDAAFFVVYVGQGPLTPQGYDEAYRAAIEKFDAIHRLTEEIAPDRIELALTAADVRRIAASGKKVALIGVENGYPLGTDIGRVKEFYDRGGRYMSLAHNGHSQLADSNTGERDGNWMHDGLSEMGREVVAEMNRLGMMIDVSHPSKAAMMEMAELSRAPIIASHSACRALCNHSRNMDDEQLRALAATGGVIQMVAFNSYVKTPPEPSAEGTAALAELREQFALPTQSGGAFRSALAAMPAADRERYERRAAALEQQFPPPPRATVADFVDHIDYAVDLIGIDHVGISSDFDGGGGLDGWDDASETFNVTLELVRRGYSEEEIAKIWSGNLLRVMEEAARVAQEIQAGT